MNKFLQKGMIFVISLVLGIVLMTQIRTAGNILGSIDAVEKTGQLNEELTRLNIEKNKLREELEALKEEDLDFLAKSAYEDACAPGNPKDASIEDLKALFRKLM